LQFFVVALKQGFSLTSKKSFFDLAFSASIECSFRFWLFSSSFLKDEKGSETRGLPQSLVLKRTIDPARSTSLQEANRRSQEADVRATSLQAVFSHMISTNFASAT
jgi:hypothetical protein